MLVYQRVLADQKSVSAKRQSNWEATGDFTCDPKPVVLGQSWSPGGMSLKAAV